MKINIASDGMMLVEDETKLNQGDVVSFQGNTVLVDRLIEIENYPTTYVTDYTGETFSGTAKKLSAKDSKAHSQSVREQREAERLAREETTNNQSAHEDPLDDRTQEEDPDAGTGDEGDEQPPAEE